MKYPLHYVFAGIRTLPNLVSATVLERSASKSPIHSAKYSARCNEPAVHCIDEVQRPDGRVTQIDGLIGGDSIPVLTAVVCDVEGPTTQCHKGRGGRRDRKVPSPSQHQTSRQFRC